MNLEEQLRKRFEKVIADTIKPPILVGAKWMRPGPGKGQFQFLGVPKIAKATGRNIQRVAKHLLKHAELGDLKLNVKVSPAGLITLSPIKGGGKKPTPETGQREDSEPADSQ